MKPYYIYGALAVMAATSCSHDSGWSIRGKLDNAPENATLALEANNAGHWYALDSIKVDKNGNFSYTAPAPLQGQDILRITLPGKGSIYFPIDSIDKVDITADAGTFGTGHTLSGSALTSGVVRVDSIVASTDDPIALRRELINVMTADTTGLISYYALGKSVDGKPLFDPAESLGNRAYGAVAQVYASRRPLDPKGTAVQKAYFEGRRKLGKVNVNQQVIELPETGFIDIVRYDARGKQQSLKELSQGKVVIVNFAQYDLQGSPAINAMLNALYSKYHDKGLEIYQLAFDNDEVSWREAARNLPWTAVWNAPSDGPEVLAHYNVGSLPLFYIIDRNGDLIERIETPADLPGKVAKQF